MGLAFLILYLILTSLALALSALGCWLFWGFLRSPRLVRAWRIPAAVVAFGAIGVVLAGVMVHSIADVFSWQLATAAVVATASFFAVRGSALGPGTMAVGAVPAMVLVPAFLLIAVDVTSFNYWRVRDECSGRELVAGAERYRAILGTYPTELHDMFVDHWAPLGRPAYTAIASFGTLPPGQSCLVHSGHVLYTGTPRSYTIGTWWRPTLLTEVAAYVCRYSSNAPTWRCAWNDWGPFSPQSGTE